MITVLFLTGLSLRNWTDDQVSLKQALKKQGDPLENIQIKMLVGCHADKCSFFRWLKASVSQSLLVCVYHRITPIWSGKV